MTSQTITPGSIVVGYRGERDVELALTWAAEQARLERRTLALVHVVQPIDGFAYSSLTAAYIDAEDLIKAVAEEGEGILEAGAAVVAERFPGVNVETHLLQGRPETVLERLSEHAALVVVGSRGRGRFASAVLGSVSVSVSSNSACPTVVVRPHRLQMQRHGVLVGVDYTEDTSASLEFAFRTASIRQLPLTVLYTTADPKTDRALDALLGEKTSTDDYRRGLAEMLAGLREQYPDVTVETTLAAGQVDEWLVSQSEQMDLVVVSHPRHAGIFDRLALGSFAPAVVERSDCPVAVVFTDR